MNMTDSGSALRTSHAGWSEEEDALLFAEAEKARNQCAPLKAVFESIARQTGRQPNSIRNYYYARVKQGGPDGSCIPHSPAFVPFTQQEAEELLTTVLSAQAQGISVRTCTLNMGNGDNRAMLRYQNKYRSLIRNNPELVKQVMAKMQQAGMPTFDPYQATACQPRRAGRPRKNNENLVDIMGGIINDISSVEGLDVASFFDGLRTLAITAAQGDRASKTLREIHSQANNESSKTAELMEELRLVQDQANTLNRELTNERERFSRLLRLFRQLMNLNRDFLHMNSMVKVSNLSSYIHNLEKNVEDCEKVMVEYI